jgi:hypothetical protein
MNLLLPDGYWPDKDPDEVLDYDINWSKRLASGETISTSTWSVVSGSVTINSDATSSPRTKVWLQGGSLGETCKVQNRVVTSASRTMDQSGYLRICSK